MSVWAMGVSVEEWLMRRNKNLSAGDSILIGFIAIPNAVNK
jgi:hypothetical protein